MPDLTPPGAAAEIAPAPEPEARRPLLPPAGYLVVGLVMIVTFGLTYFFTRHLGLGGPTAGPIRETYEQIGLGVMSRELATDGASLVRDQFAVHVALVLNPRLENLPQVKAQVERRRDLLKHIVATEILYPKSDADLRRPGILDALQAEIKKRLNEELGAKGGQETIAKVIFPDSKVPPRR
jgi:flagellar basal body-associated protein FliL